MYLLNRDVVVRVLVSGWLMFLAACSSGGGESDAGSSQATVRTFSASGEASRIAALYRVQRDLTSVVFPYAHDGQSLVALDNSSANCLLSGTVGYAYNPGSGGGIGQQFVATFSNCVETIGIIHGTLTLVWNASQDNTARGSFTPGWSASVSVDGVNYSILQNSTLITSYNPVSGLQQTQLNVFSGSVAQPPTGPSASLQHVSINAQTQNASTTMTLSNVFDNLQAPTGGGSAFAAGNLRIPGSCSINYVPSSTAVLGLGVPQTCSGNYTRSNRSDGAETITGAASTSSALLNLTVSGAETRLSDAGQYDWVSLVASPNWNMDGN